MGTCDDHYPASAYCDRTLQLLLRTFLDIILLRKGPEHVPSSLLILLMSVAMMVFAAFCAGVLIEPVGEPDYLQTALSSLLVLAFYAAILQLAGFGNRLLSSLSAIVGCNALLTLIFVAEYVLFKPFLGVRLAGIVATLILLWSIPVEGHIMSRAMSQSWYVGIAIAIAAFVLHYGLQSMLAARS